MLLLIIHCVPLKEKAVLLIQKSTKLKSTNMFASLFGNALLLIAVCGLMVKATQPLTVMETLSKYWGNLECSRVGAERAVRAVALHNDFHGVFSSCAARLAAFSNLKGAACLILPGMDPKA